MFIAILTLSFLLSLMPLVIGTCCYRYKANFYSGGILGLSAVGCVLGLAQFGLLLGTFYKLFPKDLMKEAGLWMQYVNITGGVVMICAGVLWVGFFRKLMKGDEKVAVKAAPVRPAAVLEEAMAREDAVAAAQKVKAPKRRREAPDAMGDFFAEEVPVRRVVRMAAVVSRKESARSKVGVAKKVNS